MAQLKATIVVTYDVPDDHGDRVRMYGTADLVDMAKMDEANARENPEEFLHMGEELGSVTLTVEPVE
jgi:hypothetical protein